MVPSPDTGLLCPHGWPKIPGCRMRGNSEQQPSECPQNCAGVTVNTHEKQKDGKLTLCRFCIILEEPTVAHRSSALLLLWWLFPARKGGAHESCALSSFRVQPGWASVTEEFSSSSRPWCKQSSPRYSPHQPLPPTTGYPQSNVDKSTWHNAWQRGIIPEVHISLFPHLKNLSFHWYHPKPS